MNVKPWKPPTRREYKPKPTDAGQRIEYVRITPAHWEGRTWNPQGQLLTQGTWVDETVEIRTGTVWSVAMVGTEFWVQPDDDTMHPVLVKKATKTAWQARHGEFYEITGQGEAARARIRLAERVRKTGIFPVVDFVSNSSRWGQKRAFVKWHSDEWCEKTKGKELFDLKDFPGDRNEVYGYYGPSKFHEPWSVHDVVRILVGRDQIPSDLCSSCVANFEADDARAA